MRGIEHIPWVYDLLMEVVERSGLRDRHLQLVGKARGRVLDLGCGTGRNLRLFSAESMVTGLELDLGLLAAARRKAPDLPLVVGRAENLPFRSRSFETVVSSLVFCSVADSERGLQETARILDQHGQLRMLEHVRSSHRLLGWLQDVIQPVRTWLAGGCHPNRRTEAMVEQAGFVIERHGVSGRTIVRCFVAHPRRTAPEVD